LAHPSRNSFQAIKKGSLSLAALDKLPEDFDRLPVDYDQFRQYLLTRYAR